MVRWGGDSSDSLAPSRMACTECGTKPARYVLEDARVCGSVQCVTSAHAALGTGGVHLRASLTKPPESTSKLGATWRPLEEKNDLVGGRKRVWLIRSAQFADSEPGQVRAEVWTEGVFMFSGTEDQRVQLLVRAKSFVDDNPEVGSLIALLAVGGTSIAIKMRGDDRAVVSPAAWVKRFLGEEVGKGLWGVPGQETNLAGELVDAIEFNTKAFDMETARGSKWAVAVPVDLNPFPLDFGQTIEEGYLYNIYMQIRAASDFNPYKPSPSRDPASQSSSFGEPAQEDEGRAIEWRILGHDQDVADFHLPIGEEGGRKNSDSSLSESEVRQTQIAFEMMITGGEQKDLRAVYVASVVNRDAVIEKGKKPRIRHQYAGVSLAGDATKVLWRWTPRPGDVPGGIPLNQGGYVYVKKARSKDTAWLGANGKKEVKTYVFKYETNVAEEDLNSAKLVAMSNSKWPGKNVAPRSEDPPTMELPSFPIVVD